LERIVLGQRRLRVAHIAFGLDMGGLVWSSPRAMWTRWRTLWSDPDAGRRMGVAGRRRAESHFDVCGNGCRLRSNVPGDAARQLPLWHSAFT
jgi:hypothetical protein